MDFDIDKGWSLLTTAMNNGTLLLYDLEVVFQHHEKLGELTKKGNMNGDSTACSLGSEYPRSLKTNSGEQHQLNGHHNNSAQEDSSIQDMRRVIPSNIDTTAWNESFSLTEKNDPFGRGITADGLKLTKLEVPTDERIILRVPMSSANHFQFPFFQPGELSLNVDKLKRLLFHYGEYPSKYRVLVWRFLLRLPENREAFDTLVGRGVHHVLYDLHRRYPIADSNLFRKLEKYVL